MIDPANLGRTFGPYTVAVTREHVRALAATLGMDDQRYHDPEAARAAGMPDLPAPPTLPTCYGLWANRPLLAELEAIGAPLPRLLHGEQHYRYLAPVYAGDTLTGSPAIVGLAQKAGRSGPFELMTIETLWCNQHGQGTVVDRLVVVVRGAQ